MTQNKIPTYPLDDFLDQLEEYRGQGYELSFSGLDFYRPKNRGNKTIQIEFNQTVYLDQDGKVRVTNHD